MKSANSTIGGAVGHPNPRRATVLHCPFCATENLFPDYQTDNAWQCHDCCRVFSVKFHGQIPRQVSPESQDISPHPKEEV